jgi:hypothetical protein
MACDDENTYTTSLLWILDRTKFNILESSNLNKFYFGISIIFYLPAGVRARAPTSSRRINVTNP